MITESAAERRRSQRLLCHAALQFRDLQQPGGPYTGGLAKDVSAGGLKFETAQFFSHQRRLLMQVALPGVPTPIRTVAQVVWTYKQPHNDQYEIGAQFVEITPHDREAMASYVERGVHVVARPLSAAS